MFVKNGTNWNLMNTLESTFWGLLKSHLPKDCHAQRIETGSTGLGIPDVNMCWEGKDIWVELKVVKGKRVELRPEQVAWLFRRNRSGGSSWIAARDKADGVRKGKYDKIYLWPGSNVIEVKEKGVEAIGGFVFESPFDWDAIIETLFKELRL